MTIAGYAGMENPRVDPSLLVKMVSAGTAACIAECMSIPLDTAKVRLQIQGESKHNGTQKLLTDISVNRPKYRGLFGTLRVIAKEEGPRALYSGLHAGLQRQMCFATIRVGFYDDVKRKYAGRLYEDPNKMTMGIRISAGITTGGLSVCVAQPTDVVKVRMQAQGMSASGPKYLSPLHAYKTIIREEGVGSLYKGFVPNFARNAIVNVSELVTYDMIKETILSYGLMSDNIPLHFLAGFGAGFCATVVASPVDVVKTRYMNSPANRYTGVINCAVTIMREGGVKAYYKG
ncbi:hypothetical protein CHS0354_025953, partial [Potamilus streckersoni]